MSLLASILTHFAKRPLPLIALLSFQHSSDAVTLYASAYDQTGGTGNILRIDNNGTALVWDITWDQTQKLDDPEGIALDAAGNLYVNDGSYLFKITPDGYGTTLVDRKNNYQSNGIAIDGAGNLYVGTYDGNASPVILKYNSSGTLLST